MWREPSIGMIGRDSILRNKILPRINAKKQFILSGQAGIGKTALLEWAFEQCNPGTSAKAFTTGALAHGQMIKEIADQWGIPTAKTQIKELEKLILQQSGNFLFIDELIRLSTASITFLKVVKERNQFYGAMRSERMKEDLKQLLWGFEIFKVGSLSGKDNTRLALQAALHFGCNVSHHQIAVAAHGVPGRIHSFCKTGEIPKDDTRMRSEEIDISPVIFMGAVFLILLRYVGRATSATDLVMVGGFAMVLMIVLRGVFSSARKKN